MKVVYIPDEPEQGGAYNSFREMVYELAENYGVEPIILTCKDGKYNRFAERHGYESYVIGHRAFYINKGSTTVRRHIKRFLFPYYYIRYKIANYKALKIAERYLNFDKISLIHTNVNRNDIGAVLAHKYQKPHIWHLREYGQTKGEGKNDFQFFSLRPHYIDFMNKHTDVFISISKAVACHWINNGINLEKVHLVYNGVNKEKYYIKNYEKHFVSDDKIHIIMVGAINPQKGQLQLLRSLIGLPENVLKKIKVDFFGSCNKEYKWYLENFIKKNCLKEIVKIYEYYENIYEILPEYDIGVVATVAEGFGRVTVEYMMAGICVIAANTGANPELIIDRETGMLFEYDNIGTLEKCIVELIENVNFRERLKVNAQKYAVENFTNKKNAQDVYKIYETLKSK